MQPKTTTQMLLAAAAFGLSIAAPANASSHSLMDHQTAGHNGKFYLSSADGSFDLKIAGQLQFRYVSNFDSDSAGTDTDGFELRRTKLGFSGTIYDNFDYKVKGAFSRSDGEFHLEDASIGTKLGDGWKLKFGQFKERFLREENTSSSRQLTVDRSVVNEVFNQDFSQGVELSWKGDNFAFFTSFSDGFGSDNTNFSSNPADYSVTARVEWLAIGDSWKPFKDFTSKQGSDDALLIGAAVNYQEGVDVIGGGAQERVFNYTVDAGYESNGWSLYGAFVGQSIEDIDGGSTDADIFGYLVQGGFYVNENWEVFGRYDQIINDDDLGDDFATLTLGVNNYIHGHAAKFTVDLAWFFDDTSSTGGVVGGNSGIGLISGSEEDQLALRAQFQLLF